MRALCDASSASRATTDGPTPNPVPGACLEPLENKNVERWFGHPCTHPAPDTL
ncbi:hypothetical protein MYCTH_87116 [Thermothelomyces thermophilus ATCC 42464]|uniref:Uncharacterized protein n=1 Tax=Thermothelomyces thermophilus (strain ATCC 42464 / BCRC 31852 / DSM 1799) TaxID=573729 RepID=G2Q5Y0_THET4|nr:uncharacterized protein MYCTH_87116 [Thermothelomyces thermophilus ATCC 42464]AEO54657.1 hypothetical protein MYCTH_87116 [Thermothelomyces thermophilus ATCC 42464]